MWEKRHFGSQDFPIFEKNFPIFEKKNSEIPILENPGEPFSYL